MNWFRDEIIVGTMHTCGDFVRAPTKTPSFGAVEANYAPPSEFEGGHNFQARATQRVIGIGLSLNSLKSWGSSTRSYVYWVAHQHYRAVCH